jgi:hypothetical protein
MKKIIYLLLLCCCIFQLNAQSKKEIAAELLAAREPTDSIFVEFNNGHRSLIKSLKNIQETGKVKVDFADGTKETYKIEEIKAYQTEKYYSKRINSSRITPFSIPVLATRTLRGAISCYSAFYETTVTTSGPNGGFRRDWVSCDLIEYRPGNYIVPYGDTTNFHLLRSVIADKPDHAKKFEELVSSYNYKKYKKKPWEFMELVYDFFKSYNKAVAEGK